MTSSRHSLSALLALALVVVGCDSGAKNEGKPKAAPADKGAAAAKAEPGESVAQAPPVETPKTDPAPAADGGTPPAVADEPIDDTALPPDDGGDVEDEPAEAEDGGEPEDVAADDADPADDADDADDAEDPEDEAADDDDHGAAAVAGGAEVNNVALDGEAELLRLVLAHDVVDRQPVDPSTSFPSGQKVNLFVEARNETGEEIVVRVTWETVSNGRRSPPTNVRIASRKLHRTRAYRTIKRAGDYKCIVLGEGDEELAVIPFTITE